MGRYPIHFHLARNAIGAGMYASDNSLHDNYQRCIVIHGNFFIEALLIKQGPMVYWCKTTLRSILLDTVTSWKMVLNSPTLLITIWVFGSEPSASLIPKDLFQQTPYLLSFG